MALPVIADVFRTTFDWTVGGGVVAANVLHFASPSENEADLYADLVSNTGPSLFNVSAGGMVNTGVEILALDGTSATQAFPAIPGLGGNGGTEMIVQGAGIVSLRTAVRGPRGRGRVFTPFVAEGSQVNGFLDNTDVVAMQGAWDAFLADMQTDGWTLVVASYVHADANPVTQIVVQPVIGTQRRRVDQLR